MLDDARKLRRISVTEIRTYKRCREEHRFTYVELFRALQRKKNLKFGSVMHAGLDAWWPAVSLDPALEAVRAEAKKEGLDSFALAMAEAMMIGYHERWSSEQASFRLEAVEREFEVLRANYELFGRLDKQALKDGRRVFVEHKTTGEDISPGSFYWGKLTIDDQIGLYFEGSAATGWELEACIYDVVRKPDLRPRKATPEKSRKYKKNGELYATQRERDETPEEYRGRLIEEVATRPEKYFQRGELVRLQHERERALRDIDLIAQDILRTGPGKPQPRSPDACGRFGDICPYFGVCTGQASLDDPDRFRRSKGNQR